MREEVRIINNYKNYIMNENAKAFGYNSWSDEFKLKTIREAYDKFLDENTINWNNFTKDELGSLGFSAWDDDLILMPLWAFHICKDGIVLTSFDGEEKTKGSDEIDDDVRFGCIAWGFKTKDLLKRERKMKLEELK